MAAPSATSSSDGSRLSDLQAELTAKKAALSAAKTAAEKASLKAEIELIEKQIEELKAKRNPSGSDSAAAKAAEELAKLFRVDTKNFDPDTPFGNRVLYV